jgi:hypothetical protein
MGRRILFRITLIVSAIAIAFISLFSPAVVNAAFPLNPSSPTFFTAQNPDPCWQGNCNILAQYGLYSCPGDVADQTNSVGVPIYWSKYAAGVGLGGAQFQNNANAYKLLFLPANKNGNAAYYYSTDLLAYYYGVAINPGSQADFNANQGTDGLCPTSPSSTGAGTSTDTSWTAGSEQQWSGDNIGAAFDILSVLYSEGYSIAGQYSYKHDAGGYAWVSINPSAINAFINYIYNGASLPGVGGSNTICQSPPLRVFYNTALAINNSHNFDVGTTSEGYSSNGETQVMVGIIDPNSGVNCGNIPWASLTSYAQQKRYFLSLIDQHCGNLSLQAIPHTYEPPLGTCKIVANPNNPIVNNTVNSGTPVSVYITWSLPSPPNGATSLEYATVDQSVNYGPNIGITPPGLQPKGHPINFGNTYSTTQGPSQATLTSNSPISYSGQNSTPVEFTGSLTYNVTGSDKEGDQLTVIQCTPLSVTWGPSKSCTCSTCPGTCSPTCATDTSAATTLQNTYKSAYTDWYNYDSGTYLTAEKNTAAAAKKLLGPLNVYLADVAAANAAAQLVQNDTATYQGKLNLIATDTAAVSSAQAAYNKKPNAANLARLNSAKTALTLAQRDASNYDKNYLQPATNNMNADITTATNAYNSMSGLLIAWETLSEQTYLSTTTYLGPPSFMTGTYTNPGVAYYENQDHIKYDVMVTALEKWKTALATQDAACDTKPYFTVQGGDIISGAGAQVSNGSCTDNPSAGIFASNIGSSPWTGASDNLAALAPSIIDGVSTFVGGNQLTFANTNGSLDPYGGDFGNANGTCNLDYYGSQANLPNFNPSAASGTFDISGIGVANDPSNNSCQLIDTTYYCKLNGPISIIQSSAPSGNTLIKAVLYVSGSASISENISIYNNYSNTALNYITDIPLLYVVASQNIYIDSNVSSIDGVYSASNGSIFTCADPQTGSSYSSASKLIAGCSQELNVNGSLVANQIKLGRIGNGLPNSGGWSTGPAETFNYGPNIWLSQVNSSFPSSPDYANLTELSPVL